MRIIVEGTRHGKRERITWDLVDFFSKPAQATSMSRTTAFPCTIIARMIAAGKLKTRGVLPPELLGAQPGMLESVIESLKSRWHHLRAPRRAR